ncbi:MAG: MFS transporter [Acidimicrobiales bacterium]
MVEQEGHDSPKRALDRVTLALFLVALFSSFAQFGAVASLNDVARHFGHSSSSGSLRSIVGLSGSMLGVGLGLLRLASLGALPLASLADRWGRTRVLRRAMLIGLLATASASLSPSYWIFVLCFALARPLLSAASALIQVITVELSTSAKRIHRLAIMAAGAGIGAGLSAVLHGIIRGPGSFRWLFSLALVPAFFIRPLLRVVHEPSDVRASSSLARLTSVPRAIRGHLGVVSTIAFTIGMITGPANGFAFVYGEGVLKISPHIVASVVALSAATGLAGLLLSRRLARSVGRRWTVAIGVVGSGVTSAFAYSGGRGSFVIGYLIGVGAAGVLAPAATAISTEIFSHSHRATAAGWVVVAGVLGATTGLALFGWVGDVVHTTTVTALRIPALVTFLPLLPTVALLRRLPESSRMELV